MNAGLSAQRRKRKETLGAAKITASKRRARMRKIVEAFQVYVATYTDQPSYEDYSDKTFTEDMLYGIGLALNPEKFHSSSGYERFKSDVLPLFVPQANRGTVEND